LEKVGQQDTDYPGLTLDVGRMFTHSKGKVTQIFLGAAAE